ncbi:hypothetical protein ACFTAO_02220 [Paenibacillus rhizoplanae]
MDAHLNTAMEALEHYSISCKSVDFIAQSGNTIYKVTDLDNNSYSLRLHISKGDALEKNLE